MRACTSGGEKATAFGCDCVANLASWMGKNGLNGLDDYGACSKFAPIGTAVASARARARAFASTPMSRIITKIAVRDESEAASSVLGLPLSADRIGTVPLARLNVPAYVSRVVAFLVSDEAAYMTAQSIDLTGGLWMH